MTIILMDGFIRERDQLPEKDNALVGNVSLNFNLGDPAKKVAPLWWINPLGYVYSELSNPTIMKFPKPVLDDTDNDGVLISSILNQIRLQDALWIQKVRAVILMVTVCLTVAIRNWLHQQAVNRLMQMVSVNALILNAAKTWYRLRFATLAAFQAYNLPLA
jgi:hypothetical protein